MRHTLRLLLPLAAAALLAAPAAAQTDLTQPLPLKEQSWSFDGPFGHYDRAETQRGLQVFKEVCSACHSLNRVAFHAIAGDDGIGYSEEQAKTFAAGFQVPAGPNDKGETADANGDPLKRPGTISDHMPAPFANDQAARTANGGALPPDLSVIVKARAGGSNYLYSILTGFGDKPPAGYHLPDGKYYNPYFAGRAISMPPPLTNGSVTFSDGTPSTVDNEARAVVSFLTWASEPTLEARHRIGFGVMIFLIVFAGLLYLSYRSVWAGVEH
jgi:cytochrome c1